MPQTKMMGPCSADQHLWPLWTLIHVSVCLSACLSVCQPIGPNKHQKNMCFLIAYTYLLYIFIASKQLCIYISILYIIIIHYISIFSDICAVYLLIYLQPFSLSFYFVIFQCPFHSIPSIHSLHSSPARHPNNTPRHQVTLEASSTCSAKSNIARWIEKTIAPSGRKGSEINGLTSWNAVCLRWLVLTLLNP